MLSLCGRLVILPNPVGPQIPASRAEEDHTCGLRMMQPGQGHRPGQLLSLSPEPLGSWGSGSRTGTHRHRVDRPALCGSCSAWSRSRTSGFQSWGLHLGQAGQDQMGDLGALLEFHSQLDTREVHEKKCVSEPMALVPENGQVGSSNLVWEPNRPALAGAASPAHPLPPGPLRPCPPSAVAAG